VTRTTAGKYTLKFLATLPPSPFPLPSSPYSNLALAAELQDVAQDGDSLMANNFYRFFCKNFNLGLPT
jgi:hypothetical protein